MSVAIMTDTNSGIRVEEGERMGVAVLPMPIIIDGDTYYEDVNLSAPDFYRFLQEGRAVSTSQPAPADVMNMWEDLLERFDEVVYIPMSSGLSGSCQTALAFARYYDGKVQVADNRRISVTQRLSVMDALALRNAGCSALEIKRELERTALDAMIYIGVDTLEYLKRGGRVTPAAAAMATALRIKPLLKIEGDKLDAHGKAIGTDACKRKLIESIRKSEERFRQIPGSACIAAASSFTTEEEQCAWRSIAQSAFPGKKVIYDPLALSIGCHVGPGAFGMAVVRRLSDFGGGI